MTPAWELPRDREVTRILRLADYGDDPSYWAMWQPVQSALSVLSLRRKLPLRSLCGVWRGLQISVVEFQATPFVEKSCAVSL